jgi:CBS domain-containing protein
LTTASGEFAMSHRLIRDVIAGQRMVSATPQTTVSDAARLMKQVNVGAIIVIGDAGHLAGIFTERDTLFRVVAEGRDPQSTRLGDVMTRHPQTVHPDKPLGHALHMMYEGGFRHVPVVENDRPIGMVSARDALGPELNDFESELEQRRHIREIL